MEWNFDYANNTRDETEGRWIPFFDERIVCIDGCFFELEFLFTKISI